MTRFMRVMICGLAATRLVRAWRYEQIGEAPREKLIALLSKKTTTQREWVQYLLECPHCLGFWTTMGVTLAWKWRPARPVIEALAGAVIVSAFADHYPDFDLGEE